VESIATVSFYVHSIKQFLRKLCEFLFFCCEIFMCIAWQRQIL